MARGLPGAWFAILNPQASPPPTAHPFLPGLDLPPLPPARSIFRCIWARSGATSSFLAVEAERTGPTTFGAPAGCALAGFVARPLSLPGVRFDAVRLGRSMAFAFLAFAA